MTPDFLPSGCEAVALLSLQPKIMSGKSNNSVSESWKCLFSIADWKACLRTRQPCSILDLQPLKRALLLVLQSCGVSRILSESCEAHFEVCFHSSALVTLQWQLDSFICRTGGWWGVARYVWTSWFVDKEERLQCLAGTLRSFSSGLAISLSGSLL